MGNGYVGRDIPLKKDMQKKNKTSDLYMKNGVPCGDIEATGSSGKGPSGAGSGPRVGGYDMGVHNKFENGIPNAGRESIDVEVMKPAHVDNVKKSVLKNIGDDSHMTAVDASKIAPYNMGVHNTFGVK